MVKNKLKIAFIVPRFPVISETFILNQITGLMDLDLDVRIFANKKSKINIMHEDIVKYQLMDRVKYINEEKKGTKIDENKNYNTIKLFSILEKFNVIKKSINIKKYGKRALRLKLACEGMFFLSQGPFEIYHCHFGGIGRKIAELKTIGAVKGKIVTTFHGYDLTKYVDNLGDHIYKQLFATGDLFLPISNRWSNLLVELGCSKNKINVHRMGIDIKKFKIDKDKARSRRIYKIITVGRLVEKKGIEYGILSVREVLKVYPHIEYSIVGNGPLKEKYKKLIRDNNLEKIVKMVGEKTQKEVVALMEDSDLLLCPSVTSKDGDQEGIPVVLMEAMACGLPVISTFHSGIPELVENDKTGLLVYERDYKTLSKKIIYSLEYTDIMKTIAKNARDYVSKYYDIEKQNKKLLELYYKTLEKT
jgi:colanic acid/amylovoran biosynthesis glycosyltransferase